MKPAMSVINEKYHKNNFLTNPGRFDKVVSIISIYLRTDFLLSERGWIMRNIRLFFTGISLIFLIFAASGAGFSQDGADLFYVVHVEGTIQKKASGESLKLGDEIRNENEIVFMAPDASAVVINPQKGQFLLKSEEKPRESKGEKKAVCFVKNCLLPCRKNISGRGGVFIDYEQMETEVNLLISILEKSQKKRDEIKKDALVFLMNFYYRENEKHKAENVLKKILAK